MMAVSVESAGRGVELGVPWQGIRTKAEQERRHPSLALHSFVGSDSPGEGEAGRYNGVAFHFKGNSHPTFQPQGHCSPQREDL